MPDPTPALTSNEPDPDLLSRLRLVKRIGLGAVALIGLFNVAAWLVPGVSCAFGEDAHLMVGDTALTTLVCAMSLYFSERRDYPRARRMSVLLALMVLLLAASIAMSARYRISFGLGPLLPQGCGSITEALSGEIAATFGLLALSVLLFDARKRLVVQLADLAAFALCFLILVLVSGYVFGALGIFGAASVTYASPQTLLCLTLLIVVVLLRRAEKGVFAVFLGHGIGSRIARLLLPLLLIMPLIRELGRARMNLEGVIPVQYATAILTSVATMLSIGLLLFLAWRINIMETEIHELSLRDEVTGLYNLRGFSLLAEQAFRLAQRSQMAFSVLYIDLDNLKQVNDSYGHAAGSSFLAETGQLLKATFREADVMGRIGGDEFAVAGNFSSVAIAIAAERLRGAAAVKSIQLARPFPLSLSMGCATAKGNGQETLKELVAAADAAMYEDKRRRKIRRR